MAVLIEIRGDQQREFRLGAATGLGRGPANAVRLLDPLVSQTHAELCRQEDGEYILVDLASRYGTFVNAERVSRRALEDGDEIIVGATRLRFHRSFESVGGRRWNERIPCDLPVSLTRADGSGLSARAFDISIVGVGLRVDGPLEMEEQVRVAIGFPGRLRRIAAAGRVTRVEAGDVGVALIFGSNRVGLAYASAFAELLRAQRGRRP